MAYDPVKVKNEESTISKRMKILYILKILYEESSPEHKLTRVDIQNKLKSYGIDVERKSIYNDLAELSDQAALGICIEKEGNSNSCGYYLDSRLFELPELKLLIDSVQAAKFIPVDKTEDITKKLISLTDKHSAGTLARQVSTPGKSKVENQNNTIYAIDAIHDAINSGRKITFKYYTYDINKRLVEKHPGKVYKVSPLALAWKDENYYLIAYDDESINPGTKHFRVDKMQHVNKLESENEKRIIPDEVKQIGLNNYVNKRVNMFDGEMESVRLLIPGYKIGIIIDKFGSDISVIRCKDDDEKIEVKFDVALTDFFLTWLMAVGDVKILSPQFAIDRTKELAAQVNRCYED